MHNPNYDVEQARINNKCN